jgi:hypothetical protein
MLMKRVGMQSLKPSILPGIVFAVAMMLSACQPILSPSSAPSIVASTKTQPATKTPIPTPTAVRTPPALPDVYQSSYLNALDTPHTYITGTCQYLLDKWDSHHAAPGTIVLVVMLHSLTKGHLESSDSMGVADFARMMDELHAQQFQAITLSN